MFTIQALNFWATMGALIVFAWQLTIAVIATGSYRKVASRTVLVSSMVSMSEFLQAYSRIFDPIDIQVTGRTVEPATLNKDRLVINTKFVHRFELFPNTLGLFYVRLLQETPAHYRRIWSLLEVGFGVEIILIALSILIGNIFGILALVMGIITALLSVHAYVQVNKLLPDLRDITIDLLSLDAEEVSELGKITEGLSGMFFRYPFSLASFWFWFFIPKRISKRL